MCDGPAIGTKMCPHLFSVIVLQELPLGAPCLEIAKV
jgi:hypothetical protein